MPLAPGFYGTNASGSETMEYCKFCFQKGGFTDPDLTLPQMIQKSISQLVEKEQMPEDQARLLSESVIPTLKRWKNTQNTTL